MWPEWSERTIQSWWFAGQVWRITRWPGLLGYGKRRGEIIYYTKEHKLDRERSENTNGRQARKKRKVEGNDGFNKSIDFQV